MCLRCFYFWLGCGFYGRSKGYKIEKEIAVGSLTFWYEFASPYSYIAMMRFDDVIKGCDVEVTYQPFLLGPIFKESGWETSPFLIYDAKGRHFFRDIVREARHYGLPPLQVLDEFPQSGLHACRIALVGFDEGWGLDFSKALFRRQFVEGLTTNRKEDCLEVLEGLGIAGSNEILARAGSDDNKARLRAVGEAAKDIGIFGAPSFVVGDELFWGNDRLERAVEWALRA